MNRIILKQTIKWIVAIIFYYFGIFKIVHYLNWKKRKILVVGYHKIREMTQNSMPGMITSPSTFIKHVFFLKKNYEIINEQQFHDILSKKKDYPKKIPCLITFDDGWGDNYHNVFKKFQDLPILIFLPVQLILNGDTLWQEIIFSISSDDHKVFDRLVNIVGGKNKPYRSDAGQQEPTPVDLIYQLKTQNLESIKEKINMAGKDFFNTKNADKLLSPDLIMEMSTYAVDYGSHTLNHIILTREADSVVKKEVTGSKKVLENMISREISSFCYPNGSYNEKIEREVITAGYKVAFTCDRGLNRYTQNPFRIKRNLIHEGISKTARGTYSEALFSLFLEGL